MSKKNFSEAQMRRYFKGSSKYTTPATISAVGLVLLVFGIFVDPQLRILALPGLALLVLGVGIIVYMNKSQPTDKEYDEWVEWQGEIIESTALTKVHMHQSELIRTPLSLHGVVVPGSKQALDTYGSNVFKKESKDGYRYSVNVFTYFFPAEHHMAVLSCDVDALNQRTHIEVAEHYFYKDMVGVFTREARAQDETERINLQIQSFSLRVSNGDAIGIGGVLSVKVLDNKKGAPKVAFADNEVSKTVSALLAILRQKKRDQPMSGSTFP